MKAIFYILGVTKKERPDLVKFIEHDGHILRTHGLWHRHGEKADRPPYSWLGFTGGFWFRLFPLWFTKWQVRRKGMFYIHPHDLDRGHPKIDNPWLNWKRHVGLKTAREKLKRLLQEVTFENPHGYW